jgi:hypothetical protein
MSDRGYVWLAFGDAYIEASNKLASSIKSHNRHNQICVITDKQSIDKFKNVDKTVPFEGDSKGKFEKEWQVFKLSPFTHTIKLEADMIFTSSTDWWWNYLHQWDMVHSYDFRKSIWSMQFYLVCKNITTNWNYVRDHCLKNCFDEEPTTDVVYALANKMLDPLQIMKVDYDWFKFVHNKNDVNGLPPVYKNNDFLQTYKQDDALYLGGHRQSRIWHYHEKDTMEKLDARIF